MSTVTIDGNTTKDPLDFSYDERFTPFEDSYGRKIVSAYTSATCTFNQGITKANFFTWSQFGDEAIHTVVCPKYLDISTTDTYTGAFIEYLTAGISVGIYFYSAQFHIRRIDIQKLGLFGSV